MSGEKQPIRLKQKFRTWTDKHVSGKRHAEAKRLERVEATKEYIRSHYGINVTIATSSSRTNHTRVEPLNLDNAESILEITKEEVSKYPPEFIQYCRLQNITIAGRLYVGDHEVDGFASINGIFLIPAVNIRSTIHHEIWHKADSVYTKKQSTDRYDRDWARLNPEGEKVYLRQDYFKPRTERPSLAGFTDLYGRMNEGEDRAEIAKTIMTNRLIPPDVTLGKKIQRMRAYFLRRSQGRMDEDYFRNLAAGLVTEGYWFNEKREPSRRVTFKKNNQTLRIVKDLLPLSLGAGLIGSAFFSGGILYEKHYQKNNQPIETSRITEEDLLKRESALYARRILSQTFRPEFLNQFSTSLSYGPKGTDYTPPHPDAETPISKISDALANPSFASRVIRIQDSENIIHPENRMVTLNFRVRGPAEWYKRFGVKPQNNNTFDGTIAISFYIGSSIPRITDLNTESKFGSYDIVFSPNLTDDQRVGLGETPRIAQELYRINSTRIWEPIKNGNETVAYLPERDYSIKFRTNGVSQFSYYGNK